MNAMLFHTTLSFFGLEPALRVFPWKDDLTAEASGLRKGKNRTNTTQVKNKTQSCCALHLNNLPGCIRKCFNVAIEPG